MRCTRVMLAAVVVLVAGLSSAGPTHAVCSPRIGWEPYVPHQFVGEDGAVTGADIELMRDVAGAIGCDYRFEELPWARQLLELRSGVLDLVEPHSLHMPGDAFHLMLSRASIDAATVAAIDARLEEMRADGSLAAIMARFLE